MGTLDGGTTADKEVVMSEECVFRAKFDRQSGALIAFYDFMEIYQNEPDYIDLTTQPLDIIHNNDVSIYSLDLDINLNKSWIDIITPKVCKANEKISFFKLSLFMGKKWTAIRWSAHCLNGHLQLNQRFRQLKCTF
ncbi:MAG: hypothetical protein ISR65_13735 [Bacteriovoracaceae bacterium]|nr:hypothetical protein [Bacteriovoracaceae bacterium]